MTCPRCNSQLTQDKRVLKCPHCLKEIKNTRTEAQNNALHLYLALVAEELDRGGHTMQDVVKAIRRAEIRPTKDALKEVVWKPLQEIMLNKKSTTQLTKLEVDKVYEIFNKWLGDNFEIHIPFPSDQKSIEELTGARIPL
jgi:uncharacterized Zn ribbon protein